MPGELLQARLLAADFDERIARLTAEAPAEVTPELVGLAAVAHALIAVGELLDEQRFDRLAGL